MLVFCASSISPAIASVSSEVQGVQGLPSSTVVVSTYFNFPFPATTHGHCGDQDDRQECHALVHFDWATGSKLDWELKTKGKRSLCNWSGVMCAHGFLRVSRLDLQEKALSGTIPTELGMLSMISYMNLKENALSGTLPSELTQLSELKELALANNLLSGTISPGLCSHFAETTSHCDLSGNPFACPLPSLCNETCSASCTWPAAHKIPPEAALAALVMLSMLIAISCHGLRSSHSRLVHATYKSRIAWSPKYYMLPAGSASESHVAAGTATAPTSPRFLSSTSNYEPPSIKRSVSL